MEPLDRSLYLTLVNANGYSLVLGAGRGILLSLWGRLRSSSLFSLTVNKDTQSPLQH